MAKIFQFCALLVLLGLLVEPSTGIKCWECRSDTDPKCADPFDNSTVPITDCKQEPDLPHLKGIRPKMCRKIRQKVNGEWRYFRSCAYVGEVGIAGDERFCLMRTGTYNIFMEYCTCDSKDGCNSATSYQPHHLLLCFGICVSVVQHLVCFFKAFR
ncbi:protein quiver-like [Schistocerca serialis cubense]|uniref:protein quiver-like n=1 Tax=Schistocerca serialis cubense TaxID=2023355 RepID=UPI00214E88EF|nr:protein quiver-like [Schistocerca serialis cubense]